jgi:hypothetical protein
MSEPLSIQIPITLEQPLTRRAAQLNLSLENSVPQSLHQLAQETGEDHCEDESKESILASLRTALQEVQEGKVYPIEELWN